MRDVRFFAYLQIKAFSLLALLNHPGCEQDNEALNAFLTIDTAQLQYVDASAVVDAMKIVGSLKIEALRCLESSSTSGPFAFEIARIDSRFPLELQVTLETSNEVAMRATEADLRALWNKIEPILDGDTEPLSIRTRVPGAESWAYIWRAMKNNLYSPAAMQQDDAWEVRFWIDKTKIDAPPFCFMSEIDHSLPGQEEMFVTLPVANRIQQQLARIGWDIRKREVDVLEISRGFQGNWDDENVSMQLTPESLRITSMWAHLVPDDPNDALPIPVMFVDTVNFVFREFGLANEIQTKLYSVIGSPEYLRAVKDKPLARWTWEIGELEVLYSHGAGFDTIDAWLRRR